VATACHPQLAKSIKSCLTVYVFAFMAATNMEYAECVLFAHYQISIKQSAFVQMGQYSI
jgi:hypothetical protein